MKTRTLWTSIAELILLMLGYTPAMAAATASKDLNYAEDPNYTLVSSKQIHVDRPGYSGSAMEYVLAPSAMAVSDARRSCTVTVQAGNPYPHNATTAAAAAWVTDDSGCITVTCSLIT